MVIEMEKLPVTHMLKYFQDHTDTDWISYFRPTVMVP